jgi:hypothetical protein
VARSRAVAVLGMHRSGTSAVARGMSALGVELGNDFLEATPENPTGYWEDRQIVQIDDRLLQSFGLQWDDAGAIDPQRLRGWRVWTLRRWALRHLKTTLARSPLWGFKDPRAIRVLPFWRDVLAACGADAAYVFVLRNPASVAASLHARQRMPVHDALRLWLAYVVPFFRQVAAASSVVVDYDRVLHDPVSQMLRISDRLNLSNDERAIERYAREFLDGGLRHSALSASDVDVSCEAGRGARDADPGSY